MSNIIVEEVTPVALIDWTYSRWGDPASDLAYIAFWCIKRGRGEDIRKLLNNSYSEYHNVGLRPEKTLAFFLAYKCIEYGRFKGQSWISLGTKLLDIDDADLAIKLMIENL